MRRAALLALLAAVTLPAVASAQTFTIVNHSHLTWAHIRRAERAVRLQSRQLRRYWHTPLASFGPGGWTVEFVPVNKIGWCGCYGFHGLGTPGVQPPAVEVGVGGRDWVEGKWRANWQITFSHEILETLVDPYGTRKEVCDPVEWHYYLIDDVAVSAFVTPTGRRIASYP